MDSNINQAILKTLIYHDLFDYPLTAMELWKLLIWENNDVPSRDSFSKALLQRAGFDHKRGYYFLNGREDIIYKRIARHYESKRKNFNVKKIASFLKFIPTIKFLGISGSLSMNNSNIEDDIDLFVIARKNTLWITRFFTTLLVFVLGKKRGLKTHKIKDKICLNMFVSEDNLSFDQNLFIAHEIVQLKPLISRGTVYEDFLHENMWLNNFLPNVSRDHLREKKRQTVTFIEKFIKGIDVVFFTPQYLYMKSKITRERIEKNRAEFHPRDTAFYVLSFYRARCASLIKGYGLKNSAFPAENSFVNELN